ncbi:MAG: hypothetical protein IPN42_02535 [Methylococcaceae bacterium]|nr:hypothetical protein [Methylococcaceae bacterium]
MYLANDLTINKLHLKHTGENSPTLRLRLSHRIGGLDVKPANIPPSAILIVKQLVDPLPNRVDLSQGSAGVDRTWERAVQNQLSQIYTQAARPAQGYVPANAEAVVFSGEAEMLACLTTDLIVGEVSRQWWWRTFLKNLPYSANDNVTKLLCDRPTKIPAILHELSRQGKAQTVVNGLSPGQVSRILSVLLSVNALPDFREDIPETNGLRGESPEKVKISPLPAQKQADGIISLRLTASYNQTPWTPSLPSGAIPRHWSKEKACLLGLGLTLHYEPAAVRAGTFHQKLRHWWHTLESMDTLIEQSIPTQSLSPKNEDIAVQPVSKPELPKIPTTDIVRDSSAPEQVDTVETQNATEADSSEHPNPISLPLTSSEVGFTVQDIQVDSSKPISNQDIQVDTSEPVSKISVAEFETVLPSVTKRNEIYETSEQTGISSITRNDSKETSRYESELHDEESQQDSNEQALLFENGIDTQLSGVFYLINLMTQLDLPQFFEEDCRLASQVGAWGVLEIIARALLSEADGSFSHDPIWQALAELDGRAQDELPGGNFQGFERYYLPMLWPGNVGDTPANTYCWGTDGNRYSLWSEQGYILADDIDLKPSATLRRYFPDAKADLSQHSYANRPVAELGNPLLVGLNPLLGRWLALVLPYIKLRLRLALSGTPILTSLLLQPGRLYLTSTHVDLVLKLSNVSIPVRMAGLDFDPGWMPDFGRIVLFHYE